MHKLNTMVNIDLKIYRVMCTCARLVTNRVTNCSREIRKTRFAQMVVAYVPFPIRSYLNGSKECDCVVCTRVSTVFVQILNIIDDMVRYCLQSRNKCIFIKYGRLRDRLLDIWISAGAVYAVSLSFPNLFVFGRLRFRSENTSTFGTIHWV